METKFVPQFLEPKEVILGTALTNFGPALGVKKFVDGSFAVRYERLSYDEMLNMKVKVLHDRCVLYAKEKKIRIHLRGTFSAGAGTLIA